MRAARATVPAVTAAALVCLVCGAPGVKPVRTDDETIRCAGQLTAVPLERFTDGFCGEDIFRLLAEGVPRAEITGRDNRRASAAASALLAGRYRAREIFTGYTLEQYGMTGTPPCHEEREKRHRALIDGLARAGTIIYLEFDENDTGRAVFEVRGPGLRSTVMTKQDVDCRE